MVHLEIALILLGVKPMGIAILLLFCCVLAMPSGYETGMECPLQRIAYLRSGDKGDNCNIGRVEGEREGGKGGEIV